MRVRKKFIQLTKFTYPYGTENQLKCFLPSGYKEDEHGNFYIKIGDKPSTMFTCHLDTACKTQSKIKHSFSKDGRYIGTDGNTILGADDKAGMVVLLSLIEKQVPGLYYFFIGEEVGCIGSNALSNTWVETEFSEYIMKCISFDRRGTKSVITEQLYGRCASDEFAEELSMRLNLVGDFEFSPDDTGILTDSMSFMDLIPECTNISVGYYNEHSGSEVQDVDFLKKLCSAVCEIDWETLPVLRDPISDYYLYNNFDEDDEEEEDMNNLNDYTEEWSSEWYSYFKDGDDVKKMYISKSQIIKEKSIIRSWLFMTGTYGEIVDIIWDGNKLKVIDSNGRIDFVGNRVDLSNMIPELWSVYKSSLREELTRTIVM